MNRPKQNLTLGAVLLLCPLTPSFAQTAWETVDNLAKSRGRDIVVDAGGNFISLAIDDSTSITGPVTSAISVSADHGATWQTVGSIAGYALDLTVAPDGTLYASGNRSATVSGKAFVWKSVTHGATWTAFDPWAGQSGTFLCTDVAAGNSGAIYLSGSISGGNRWVVRKGATSPSGMTWSTVDNFPATGLSQPNSVFVRAAAVGQPDDVLVCGKANNLWTVRRSSNSGASWSTVDAYNFAGVSGYENSAFAATIAPDGAIHVVGRVSKPVGGTTEYGWLVRKSANGGMTWANTDYVANGWPQYSITADNFGRVIAVGFVSTSPNMWLVRGSSDGGATWMGTDLFFPSGATTTQADAVAIDGAGNVCVVGELVVGTSRSAPIRRLAAP
jgi:hypothetical protein